MVENTETLYLAIVLISEQKPSEILTVYTERDSRWCLTINIGIDIRSRIQNLANFTLNFEKNSMNGCWRIGRVKI